MRVTYQAPAYGSHRVTGRYVRYHGVRRGFTVYETMTGTGAFAGRPGMGPTLREYTTDGADLPPAVAARARQERTTIKWD